MANKNPKEKSAIDIIRQHHGSGAVFGGNEEIAFNVRATSSGSLNLDEAIGCGGLPDGRLILISGPESSGKTMLSLGYAKKKQAEGKRILFVDAEYTWDHSWATSLGLKTDPEWMMVAQESSGAKLIELLCGKPANKKRKEAIPGVLSREVLDAMKAEGTPLGAIIVDSINTVVPPLEEDMESGAQQIGSLSRFLPPALRRLTPLLGEFGIPCIFICQARTNIAQMHGDPLTVSGGKALMHAASLWIDSRKIMSSEIFAAGDTEQEEPIGHQVRCKIRKNKVGPPSRKAEITIYYSKGVDLRPELIDQGIIRGIIKVEGKTYYYSGFASGKIIGRDNAVAAVMEDKILQKKLFEDVLGHRSNQMREIKKEGQSFVDGEQEEIVAGEVKSRQVDDGGKVELRQSEKTESHKIVTINGKRIDSDTGEVLPSQPLALDDGVDILTEDEPQEDPEKTVAAVTGDADGEASNPKGDKPVLAGQGKDLASLSLNALKNKAKEAKITLWYKLERDALIAALSKGQPC